MVTISRLTDDEVATLSEEFVERNMLPQSPTEALHMVNSVYSFLFITNMKKLGEKEYETYKDLDDSKHYHINVLHEETVKLVEVDKQALLNLAEGRKKYGGLDLLGVKAVDFSQSAIEIKTDREGKYLHRDKPDWDEGSLGFEIWSRPDRSKVGWAYEYTHYKSKTEWMLKFAIEKRFVPSTYCFPTVFVYVLEYEVGREVHPYATICFENTEALFNFVDSKLDGRLINWREDIETKIPKNGDINGAYMQDNMLYISMKELCALPDVTVTLFEDIPSDTILLSNVDQRYKAAKQPLIKHRTNYLRSVVTSNEERERRTSDEQVLRDQITEKNRHVCSMPENV